MVHGEEKARDMVRSLLPSTQRENARRDRATIHRAHRRHFREELRRLTRDPEDFEDRADLEDEPTTEIRLLVRHRRSADKIPPFLRWATAHARPMPQESRLSHLRALVPRGLIGDHALGHLQHSYTFQSPAELAFEQVRRAYWERQARRRRPYRMNRGEQAEWLRALLQAPEGHRVFNAWLRARHLLLHADKHLHLPPVRLLLGMHDVRPFLGAIWDRKDVDSWRIPLEDSRNAVNTFLCTLKQHRGDVAATARALELAPRPPR